MAAIAKIPERLHQEIANMIADSKPCHEIKTWLFNEHNIITSLTAVTNLARKIRLERQEAAKAAYAQEVEKTAGHDLRTMDKVITSLERKYLKAIDDDNADLYLKIANELNKWNARRIELSGISREIHTTNLDEVEDSRDEFISSLQKINESGRNSN